MTDDKETNWFKRGSSWFLLAAIFGTIMLFPFQWICVGIGLWLSWGDDRIGWTQWASLMPGPIGGVFSWLTYCDLEDVSSFWLKWGPVIGEVVLGAIAFWVVYGSKISKAKKLANSAMTAKSYASMGSGILSAMGQPPPGYYGY